MQPAQNSNLHPVHANRHAGPGYKLTIQLADRMISGNVMLRWHWRKRNAHTKRIRHDVGWLIQPPDLPPEPLMRSKVELVAILPRLMDLDNLYTGAKPYIDALTRSSVIRDDAVRYINLSVNQRQHSVPGIVITVTGLPPA